MLQRPGRLGGNVDDIGEPDFRRHRHAVLDVAVALAEHLQIDREHERAAFGFRRPRQDVPGETAVLDDVELKPEWPARGLRDIFNRADRHRGQRVRDAGVVRGLRSENFAVAVLHAGEPDGRERKWRRDLLSKNGRRKAAVGDVDQHALAQLDVFEVAAVGPQRFLAVGAAIGIFEKGARNTAAGQRSQVLDAGDGFHDGISGVGWSGIRVAQCRRGVKWPLLTQVQ